MKPRRTRRRRPLLRALTAFAVGALALLVAWKIVRRTAGEPSEALKRPWHEGERVVDRHGRLMREIPTGDGFRRHDVPLDEMGDRIVSSTLAGEDKDFYEHDGVDVAAITRALGQNAIHGRRVSGGSTITQQLVKILDHEGRPHERSVFGKIVEAARAKNLEEVVSKRTILEAYLNRLSYGHGLVGPYAAARAYFNAAPRDLSWAQAAFLAVLPRAPSMLDPYAHADRVVLRQRALLEAMHARGVLGAADLARALSEPVTPRPIERPFLAPALIDALRAHGQLEPHGTTTTTIDLDLQRDVDALAASHVAQVRRYGATDAAVIVVDNETLDVLAYVGGAGSASSVDMARARRQPGSTLKPFVYALAFSRGHTGAEMLADLPTNFGAGYAPENFDGTFQGPISAREALAGSLNVPAVRLASELGAGELLDALHRFGFASLDGDAAHYGLSIVLGSGEVTLRELAEAYAMLARGGERAPLRWRTTDPAVSATSAVDPEVAAMIAEILSDPLARSRALHGLAPLNLGYPVALKTGTSSGFRDAWTIGFTHERTVAVWIGDPGGAPMGGLAGASGAGPLFADVMRRAMRDVDARGPVYDESRLAHAEVCPLSGRLAGDACPDRVTRPFRQRDLPRDHCDLHVHARVNTRTGEWRCDWASADVIALLPPVFDAWLASRPRGAPGEDPHGTPWLSRGAVSGCGAFDDAARVEVRVESPAPGAVIVASKEMRVRASASRSAGLLDYMLDGRIVACAESGADISVPVTAGDLSSSRARPIHRSQRGSSPAVSVFDSRSPASPCAAGVIISEARRPSSPRARRTSAARRASAARSRRAPLRAAWSRR